MGVAAGGVQPGHTLARVTVDTEQLAVADDAHARISRRLHVVYRKEVRAVHRLSHRRIEGQPRRNRWHRDAVARRALTLRMAGRAKVCLGGGLQSVLAQEVIIVHDVAFRRDSLGCELDMTAVTIAHVPLTGVHVTTEAGGHVGSKSRVLVFHIDVAPYAIPGAGFGVSFMGEDQVFACHLRCVTGSRSPMAVRTSVWIVRVLMALDALLRGWKVKWTRLAGALNPSVALEAIDPLEYMGSMFE
jgi:hypothetical protein